MSLSPTNHKNHISHHFIRNTGEMGTKQHCSYNGTIPSKPVHLKAQHHRSLVPANRRVAPTILLRQRFQSSPRSCRPIKTTAAQFDACPSNDRQSQSMQNVTDASHVHNTLRHSREHLRGDFVRGAFTFAVRWTFDDVIASAAFG